MLSSSFKVQRASMLRPRRVPSCRPGLSRTHSIRVRAAESMDSKLERKFGLKIKESKEEWDVIVIGSGPAGATYARKLVPAGVNVLMVDAGARGGSKPGWHQKNSYKFQKDINSFASHIRSALHTLSVPADWRVVDTLDPLGYNPLPIKNTGFVRGNQNPYQNAEDNLSAAAATYAVGGQATHWTCACPRPHPEMEANMWFPDEEAFNEAEFLLNVNQDTFMPYSLRDQVLNSTLNKAYAEKRGGSFPSYSGDRKYLYKYGDKPQPLPLAAERNQKNRELVTWTGADTVLGEDLIRLSDDTNGHHGIEGYGQFEIWDNTVCHGFSISSSDKEKVEAVYLFDALNNELKKVRSKMVVVAAGTVLTPQLVWMSLENHDKGSTYERLPALGKYLTEQPMAFCQVIWRRDIVHDEMVPRCNHSLSFDPIPIPPNDPEPNQWIPVSQGRPWHAQVHRDAFAYGDTAPNVDTRMVVDLRWFGIVDQHEYNCVEFKTCAKRGIEDFFDLPQPTFHYRYTEEERMRMHHMMEDMLYYATSIGSFLPGSEPQFMKPGLTLHIHGTTRVGLEPIDSVVNKNSLTHGFKNLYLAGNGNIPKAIACNPTLTNVAYCTMSAKHILKQLGKQDAIQSVAWNNAVPMEPEDTPSASPVSRSSELSLAGNGTS